MPFRRLVLALAIPLLTQGCGYLELLGGRCEQDQLVVTWQASIERAGTPTGALLTSTVTPENIDRSQFTRLVNLLVKGGTTPSTVVWTVDVPQFNTNGGYIAFSHPMPLAKGDVIPVDLAFDGGGWGVTDAPRPTAAAIAIRAQNFVAVSATGTLTVLNDVPLRLAVDVTARSASGETMHITGQPGFVYQRVTKTCT